MKRQHSSIAALSVQWDQLGEQNRRTRNDYYKENAYAGSLLLWAEKCLIMRVGSILFYKVHLSDRKCRMCQLKSIDF